MNKNHNKFLLPYFILSSFLIFSCTTPLSTTNKVNTHEKTIAELKELVLQLNQQVANLDKDNEISKETNAKLQTNMQSFKEELSTQKKHIAILNRGLRSGIFVELPEDSKESSINNPTKTMLPDLIYGRSGYSEDFGNTGLIASEVKNNKNEMLNPKEQLANAEIKIRKHELKEGLIQLDELKKKFPNFDDNGRSFLLSAEAWIKLKEFNNALPEIRNFYLKYPTSTEIATAKLLEAQAFEGNESFEKAANLYNEVISLSPRSSLAENAREGMLRMRDQK